MTIEDKLDKIINLLQIIADKDSQKVPLDVETPLEKTATARLAAAAQAEAEKQDAASKQPYAKEEKTPKTEKVTKEALGDAVRAAAAVHGAEKVKSVIESFGVQRASQAPEDKWPAILAAVKGIK